MHFYFYPLQSFLIKNEAEFDTFKKDIFPEINFPETANSLSISTEDYMAGYKHHGIEDFHILYMDRTVKERFLIPFKQIEQIVSPAQNISDIEKLALAFYKNKDTILLRIANLCLVYNTKMICDTQDDRYFRAFSYLLEDQRKYLINKKWNTRKKDVATPFAQALTTLNALINNESKDIQTAWQSYRSLLKPIPTTGFSYDLIRLKQFLKSRYTWIDLKNYLLSTHSLLTIGHYGYAFIKHIYIPGLPYVPFFSSPLMGSALIYSFGIRTLFRNGLAGSLTRSCNTLKIITCFLLGIPELIANLWHFSL